MIAATAAMSDINAVAGPRGWKNITAPLKTLIKRLSGPYVMCHAGRNAHHDCYVCKNLAMFEAFASLASSL